MQHSIRWSFSKFTPLVLGNLKWGLPFSYEYIYSCLLEFKWGWGIEFHRPNEAAHIFMTTNECCSETALILNNPAKGIQYHPAGIQVFYRCAQFTKNNIHTLSPAMWLLNQPSQIIICCWMFRFQGTLSFIRCTHEIQRAVLIHVIHLFTYVVYCVFYSE